ncbi:MAG: RNA polymerase subunit sigma-54, partial [Acidobacteria bacterium]|nr:RNA polymerase subunit sigma-54 [Acidobacteriota bacterium]
WPGNIRQLANEIAQAVLLLEPGEPMDLHHLSPAVAGSAEPAGLTLAEQLERAERAAYASALAAAGGDPVQAMEQLAVSRATFYRKVKQYELRVEP